MSSKVPIVDHGQGTDTSHHAAGTHTHMGVGTHVGTDIDIDIDMQALRTDTPRPRPLLAPHKEGISDEGTM